MGDFSLQTRHVSKGGGTHHTFSAVLDARRCSSTSAPFLILAPPALGSTPRLLHLQSYITPMKARSQHATGGTNMLPPPFSLFAPEIISRVTFYRSKFVPHFLTGTSQIQHLDSASRRFSFHRLIPGRISGWAGIGARPNLERRTLSLRAGTGEGSEAPRVQSLRRSLRRLYPESERPPIFCTIAPHSPHSSSGPAFSCHPFLDTPQSHRKPRSCVRVRAG